jgi:FkbM family methyltransferase
MRLRLNQLIGREISNSPRLQLPLLTLGSRTAAWTFTPKGIHSGSIVYSLGVGTDITFDLAFIEVFGAEVFAFDPTPKSTAWISHQILPPRFHFFAWGVAAKDGSATFALTTRPDWTSYQMGGDVTKAHDVVELPVRRLPSIMSELRHDHLDLLKMDIEGAEFEVIQDLASCGLRVDQLLVEFHYHRGDRLAMERVRATIRVLESMGLLLFARSSGGHEFSFARTQARPTQRA